MCRWTALPLGRPYSHQIWSVKFTRRNDGEGDKRFCWTGEGLRWTTPFAELKISDRFFRSWVRGAAVPYLCSAYRAGCDFPFCWGGGNSIRRIRSSRQPIAAPYRTPAPMPKVNCPMICLI
jgi:hypothetical protein